MTATAHSTATTMVFVQGGTFDMGSDMHYPEEQPVRRVSVDSFWIDEGPVTNAEFARFVAETSYLTVAERPLRAADYPGVKPNLLRPGSAVFEQPPRPVSLQDPSWWHYVPGACWRHPHGSGSTLDGREDHPVVHVCLEDALAFAQWAKKLVPTEAQWELAARGGLGDRPEAVIEQTSEPWERANVWHGEFPWDNRKPDSPGTTPVKSYPPNELGLYDTLGNVWEWTSDLYTLPRPDPARGGSCCAVKQHSPAQVAMPDPAAPTFPFHVLKGGSFLCAQNYCLRYRPAARIPQSSDSGSVHIGFRCARAA